MTMIVITGIMSGISFRLLFRRSVGDSLVILIIILLSSLAVVSVFETRSEFPERERVLEIKIIINLCFMLAKILIFKLIVLIFLITQHLIVFY